MGDFVFGETNKSAEFTKKFPLGKVPAFEGSDGTLLTESNAIAYYVANDELRGGSDAATRSQVVQWMSWADSEILPASCTWVFPCMGIMQYNKNSTDRAKEDVKKALGVLNTHLLPRTFLVGERISLADISVCCTLLHLYQYVLEPSFRKPFQNVNRWFTTIINQPQVKAVVGDFKLCDKMAQFDNKKFAEVQGKIKQGGGEKKQEKKEKKEPKKEQPKKEKEPSPAAPAAPKSKDPLDVLPAGDFNMDDFKRFYSNNDEDKSVPYFWEKFDKNHYSIWYCEYKYADELSKVFMTCNLIGGMFQRVDKLRKNAFASMCVFGEDKANNISGIWVWRGQELAFPLCDDWTVDYESYDWKKLDPTSEETKKLVDQYFKWIGEDNKGRKFNQGKIFK